MSHSPAAASDVRVTSGQAGRKRRFAVVGTGGRSHMFIHPIATRFHNDCELVALCDPNPARMEYYNQQMQGPWGYHRVPTYAATDFDRMIKETKPDCVLVCTVDAFHHEYIIRAMELGCDAITEKPITIDAPKLNAIYDAIQRTGKKLRVTFNARWQPGSMLVKKLLSEGTIGEIIHVDKEYMLGTSHGADYFRRWHAQKANSGGLMLHKSTHHFDLVNWWIDAVPQTVFGFGKLAFYGKANAEKRGVPVTGQRYRGQDISKDPFAFDITASARDKQLYADAEQHDGYIRDQNVFGEQVDIEDTMSVLVKYRTGAVLNYSLNAYLPREGYHVAFNGTKGRLEYRVEYGGHTVGVEDNSFDFWQTQCIVHPMFGKAYKVEIPTVEGGHGGADPLLQEQLFSSHPPADTMRAAAQHGQGAASALIGIAANEAFATGKPQDIQTLCPGIGTAVHLHDLP